MPDSESFPLHRTATEDVVTIPTGAVIVTSGGLRSMSIKVDFNGSTFLAKSVARYSRTCRPSEETRKLPTYAVHAPPSRRDSIEATPDQSSAASKCTFTGGRYQRPDPAVRFQRTCDTGARVSMKSDATTM